MFKKAWGCLWKKVRLQKCETGFKDDVIREREGGDLLLKAALGETRLEHHDDEVGDRSERKRRERSDDRTEHAADDPEPEINGGSYTRKGWMELPETRPDDGLNIFWHNMTVGSYTGRNYSFYWDYTKLVSHWVAYPLNNGLRASGSRSDAWGLDPLLPASRQPVVTSTFRGGWARGHQLPSADRLSYNANVQTFYGTNMTPQNYNFNGEIWARLEERVRGWAGRSDTLYVVTGCVVDGKVSYTTDIEGKQVAIPNAYYKAVLSYSKSASENGGYRGCAVYLEHTHNPSETVARNHSSVMSIKELEAKTGVNFFVNLPAAIGDAAAAAVEAENPNSVNWWWN